MTPFTAQLWDADHLIFNDVSGTLDPQAEHATIDTTGSFEIHQGGILGGGISPLTDRVLRLVFDDGQAWQILITKVHASNSAGIARIEFRIDVGTGPATDRESPGV
jgi:hypothetical protein